MRELKEKTKQRLFAIFCVLLIFISSKCEGQISRVFRYKHSPEIVTKYPSKPMKFNTGGIDTLYISITVDSLANNKYDYKLFSYFPESKCIKDYWIEIGFTNGTISTFEQVFYSKEYNFAEFKIDSEDLFNLRMYKFDYISFNTNKVMEPCTKIKTKDYFVKFLQQL